MIAGAEKYGLELYPIHFFNAVPKGPIDEQGSNSMVDRILQGLKQPPGYDGVLLVLHGAMVADGFPSGDAEIVRRVRRAMGPRFPIAVTHDFHANVDPAIIANAKSSSPAKSARIWIRRNEAFRQPPFGTHDQRRGEACSGDGETTNDVESDSPRYVPSAAEADCRCEQEAEKKPGVLAVSIPGGYQYGDVPAMGPSVIVITDNDPVLAKSEAERLAAMLWELRDKLKFDLPDPAKAVSMAMTSEVFPVTLLDTGDNLGGGSAGDSTFLLAKLIRQKGRGLGRRPVRCGSCSESRQCRRGEALCISCRRQDGPHARKSRS